ncbi:MAG TPA: hypothetical protein VH353_09695 [Caulobacteraceae bacterium]|jgi:hypothetical protein|nr:hypothetical protein [Caulobacteraceae bacterium]
MRIWLAALVLAAPVAARAAPAPLSGPLAPAAEGKLQCFVPDMTRRTCQTLDSYARDTSGGIVNTSTVVVSADPPITMTTRAPVILREGRLCSAVRDEDIAQATFTVAGKPADARQTADLRTHMAEAIKALIGHEVCTAYSQSGSAFVARSTLDGAPQPDSEAFIWTSPSDAWKVAP